MKGFMLLVNYVALGVFWCIAASFIGFCLYWPELLPTYNTALVKLSQLITGLASNTLFDILLIMVLYSYGLIYCVIGVVNWRTARMITATVK